MLLQEEYYVCLTLFFTNVREKSTRLRKVCGVDHGEV